METVNHCWYKLLSVLTNSHMVYGGILQLLVYV